MSDDTPTLDSPAAGPRPGDAITPPEGQEVPPAYSRLGFKQLREICKDRGIPADGSAADLIGKLELWDLQHGKAVDTTVPDTDEEVDLLADDEPAHAQDRPDGPLLAADSPSPGDNPTKTELDRAVPASETPAGGAGFASLSAPPVGSGPATPAVIIQAAEDAPKGLPPAMIRNHPNMAAKDGLVKVGEAHGAAEVHAFRVEFPVYGHGEVTDDDHFRFIAEAHALAAQAGYTTKGGSTVGQRVGYSQDANNRRTAVYEVPLKRTK